MIYIVAMIYNVVLLAGTAYIVFWMNQSGWWFLLALVMVATVEQTGKRR